MGCNSDHMAPNIREQQHREAAELLVYVFERLMLPVPPQVNTDAAHLYGGANGEENMASLCRMLRNMSENQMNLIVYDGRNPKARRLADWWDAHQAEDAKREAAEGAALKTAAGVKEFCMKNRFGRLKSVVREVAKANHDAFFDFEESTHVIELDDGVLIASQMNGFEIWQGKKL